MFRALVGLACVGLLCLPVAAQRVVQIKGDPAAVAEGNTGFAVDLYGKLATEKGNHSVKRAVEGTKQRVWVVAPGRLVEAAGGAAARPARAALPVTPPTAEELAALAGGYEEGVV